MVIGKHCTFKQIDWLQMFMDKMAQNQGYDNITAEGLTPPSAVYRANFPTGIPIPCDVL